MRRSAYALRGNPYWVFSRFRFREAQIRAYLIREHRSGRPVAEIMTDPYLQRFGASIAARVLVHSPTIAALERDDAEAIASYSHLLEYT